MKNFRCKKVSISYLCEFGRSMIEMLGVLAVVGILSVGAVVGYRFAMTKYRSNEIINELNERTLLISTLFDKGHTFEPEKEAIPMDMGDTLHLGNPVTAYQHKNPSYFAIEVANVPHDVCENILKNEDQAMTILMGEEATDPNCPTDGTETTMTFIYATDLSETGRPECVAKGFFDVKTLTCKCSGNTIAKDGDCFCPNKHNWSELERTCISSPICDEGYFESLEKNCIPCDTPGGVDISSDQRAISLCNACEERTYNNYTCAKKCIEGSEYATLTGDCYPCDDADATWAGEDMTGYAEKTCNACRDANNKPNRYFINNICVKKGLCETGVTFAQIDTGKCQECNTPDAIYVGRSGDAYDQCLACVNDSGVKNRTVKSSHCIKTVCDSGEFMGLNGRCYTCNTPGNIEVGENSGCSACTGRIEEDGFCKMTPCPPTSEGKYIQTSEGNGGCYNCASTSNIPVTEDECHSCGQKANGTYNRMWIYNISYQAYYCYLNSCALGTEVMNHSGSCSPCSKNSSYIGKTKDAQDYCEACGDNHYYVENHGGVCVNGGACTGATFHAHSDGLTCVPCNTDTAVSLFQDSPKSAQSCNSCSGVSRFAAENKCYRCDDAGVKPVIKTDTEREACTATTCGRVIAFNSKNEEICVLNQVSTPVVSQ